MNKKELTDAGFGPIQRSPKRLIASIQGLRKSGKTRLAFTAPKPIGYIAVEIGGEEGPADQFIPDGVNENPDIQIVRIIMDSPIFPNREDFGKGSTADKDYNEAVTLAQQIPAEQALNAFYNAYYASLANCKTTVVDTGSDLWELIRMANFGRLEKIPMLSYGPMNKSMDKLIDDAFSTKGNLIMIHHMKEKWMQVLNEKTGNMMGQPSGIFEMSGYSGIPKKVQAVVEMWREDLKEPCEFTEMLVKFNSVIIDSRHNPASMGKTMEVDITFPKLAVQILGGKESDWT